MSPTPQKTMTPPKSSRSRPAKRVALYARVSTREQAQGNYPSCDSQIDEMEALCLSNGWIIIETIKDEGHRAGTLQRPGLTQLRWLVETEQVDAVICTWYNRLIGSRDFYILDNEFKAHNVAFVTIHDPADRSTASGRLLESMLVSIKAFENEQIGEKVRTKMRQRAEKGLWNGGFAPYGFCKDPASQQLKAEPESAMVVPQLFKVYTEHGSDFAVRDWLKARQIASPNGKGVWSVGTIRDLLTNRRYIAEIEINRQNKDIDDLPETEAYCVVAAPHEPLVARELFEHAQALRREKAAEHPNNPGAKARVGKGRSYSWARCQRVFPLQGIFTCADCGSAMSPHYVFHKAGGQRRTDSYIYHYVCSQYRRYGTDCDHANRVLAKDAEAWLLDRIHDVTDPDLVEKALENARRNSHQDLQPLERQVEGVREALQRNQFELDRLVSAVRSGEAQGAMLRLLNADATKLESERHRLMSDQRRLSEALNPLADRFNSDAVRAALTDFSAIAAEARPEELQRLLRLMVRRVEWGSSGSHRVQLWNLPKANQSSQRGKDWFDITMGSGCPGRTRTSDQAVNSRPLYH